MIDGELFEEQSEEQPISIPKIDAQTVDNTENLTSNF